MAVSESVVKQTGLPGCGSASRARSPPCVRAMFTDPTKTSPPNCSFYDTLTDQVKSSQVYCLVSIAEYRKLLNYTTQNYTIKSTTKYIKRKRRTALLIQPIDNLTENAELKM